MHQTLALAFVNAKVSLIEATGLSRDALHIYVALALFLTVRLVWRSRAGSIAALAIILAAALAGEWLDHGFELLRKQPCHMDAHWHDIWNTMFWPTVLAVLLPWLAPRRAGKDAAAEPSGENAERGLEQA